MLPVALVPLRMFPIPKRRLAHVTSPAERTELMDSLFRHVIGVLSDAGLRVVALAPHALEGVDADVWQDEAAGLNAALTAAVLKIGAPVIVVHADLPHVAAEDIAALLHSPGDVVIARANDGGTNALLMRQLIRPSFGPGSALRHARDARAAGLRARVIDREGLAFDVDDEAALIASSWRRSSSSPRPLP